MGTSQSMIFFPYRKRVEIYSSEAFECLRRSRISMFAFFIGLLNLAAIYVRTAPEYRAKSVDRFPGIYINILIDVGNIDNGKASVDASPATGRILTTL